MKVLIIYGQKPGWYNFENEQRLLPFLKDKIQLIKIFTKVHELSAYLQKESPHHKIYVMPLDETHMTELYNANIPAMMPRKDIIDTFSNKLLFAKYAQQQGLTNMIPTSYYAPQNSETLVVVKPPCGGASCGVYFSPLKNVQPHIFHSAVVQQYIDTNMEFAGYFVAKNGKVLRPCLAYVRVYPKVPYIKAHNDKTTQSRMMIDPVYIDAIDRFIKPTSYTGTFCVDFKLNKQGALIILEINPRLGGSLSYPQNSNDAGMIISQLIDVFSN